MENPIPFEVKRFIDEQVFSIEKLEILIKIYGSEKKKWTAKDLSQELGISEDAVKRRLVHLTNHNISTQHTETGEVLISYNPGNPYHTVISQLAELYKSQRILILKFIYSKSSESLRDFANAFRLKKDK